MQASSERKTSWQNELAEARKKIVVVKRKLEAVERNQEGQGPR